ncbi:MAG: SurA N-terminal domain-containing protein [bacterium]
MMIMKFNKMIHNKVVWWIFGSIVIITFVGWFSPRGGCDTAQPVNNVGTIDGKPVSDAELRQARFNTYLNLCIMLGRVVTITPKVDKELRDMSWKRIAALRAARELNLTATPDEVLASITRDPQFQTEGQFSPQHYQQFIQNGLSKLNATAAQYEHQLAENIILQKLHGLTASAVWLAPEEVSRMAARYADSFKVDYVSLGTNQIAAGDVKVSEADLQTYYASHTNEFVVPKKVSVRYIQIPASNYLTKATDTVDTNAIEEYYLAHTDDYSVTDTNGVKTASPLETVTAVISNKLLHEAAIQMARDAINNLSDAMVPDRDGNSQTFETVVKNAKLTLHNTGLFDSESTVPGVDAGLAFNEAAFRLRPTADEYFSTAIAGTNHAYLLALTTNTEAYIPEFTEVKDQVRPLATAKAIQSAMEARGRELHQFFQAGLNNKKTFAALAQERAMTVSTTEYFSASAAPDALSSSEILSDITLRNPGELSDVLPGTSGMMIAYVVDRKPAGQDELSTIQNQVVMNVIRRRARIIFNEWQNSLVAGDRVKDSYKAEATTDTTDDE